MGAISASIPDWISKPPAVTTAGEAAETVDLYPETSSATRSHGWMVRFSFSLSQLAAHDSGITSAEAVDREERKWCYHRIVSYRIVSERRVLTRLHVVVVVSFMAAGISM